MQSRHVFSSLYNTFSKKRALLYAITLGFLVLAGVCVARMHVQENIQAMLPDTGSKAAEDFTLLQKAPFVRKVLINLHAQDANVDALVRVARNVAQDLENSEPGLFTRVMTGPAAFSEGGADFFEKLLDAYPNLATEQDYAQVKKSLSPEEIKTQIQKVFLQLQGPEGWALKNLLRKDPLDVRRLALAKLAYVNPVPQMRLHQGCFVSQDHKNALIVADTDIQVTDSRGSEKLLRRVREVLRDHLGPENSKNETIKATLLCGHLYALANANAIKADLRVLLLCSSVAMVAIFLVFLRRWHALYIFVVPLFTIAAGAAAVSLVYDEVSGITLGFGAVLMGLSVDFALHVYYALRSSTASTATVLARITKPVVFSGLTTLCAFSVLLLSHLPGQRQLSVFSLAGLATALLLALVVFPHLVPAKRRETEKKSFFTTRLPRGLVVGIWMIVLIACAWQAMNVRINGELRSLGLIPQEIRRAEQLIQTTWGDMRGQAMIFAQGDTLEDALQKNDRIFAELNKLVGSKTPGVKPVSLAPVLPARATQKGRAEQWRDFWYKEGARTVASIRAEAEALGFASNAFAPFQEFISAKAPLVTQDTIRSLGLREVLRMLLLTEGNRVRLLTLAPDIPEVAAFFANEQDGVRFVSQNRFRRELSQALEQDFLRFIVTAACVVLGLLLLLFRNIKQTLLALTPVVSGLALLTGGMGLLGLDFNIYNILACILTIGLGVDYGIFMVCKLAQQSGHASELGTEQAVMVSGLTTLAGFGVLILATHPALHSIGVTVLLGMAGAIPAALFVIPAFYGEK